MLTQTQEKYQEVLQVAERLFREGPDWVTFFREVLGVGGAVRTAFPTPTGLAEFEQSDEYAQIQKMLVRLREQRISVDPDAEPTRVITVRIPKSMHEYLRSEAHDLRTSMNKLCISKLLQVIGEEMIPNERSGEAPTTRVATHEGAADGERASLAAQGMPGTHAVQEPSCPPPFKSGDAYC